MPSGRFLAFRRFRRAVWTWFGAEGREVSVEVRNSHADSTPGEGQGGSGSGDYWITGIYRNVTLLCCVQGHLGSGEELCDALHLRCLWGSSMASSRLLEEQRLRVGGD